MTASIPLPLLFAVFFLALTWRQFQPRRRR